MRLRTWAILVDNDGNQHLYMFQAEQQPDLDKDLLPLMEKDGITMEPEEWGDLKANGWSDAISLTVHEPMEVPEFSFRQEDNLVRLWWRAENLEEVGKWTARIIGLGGQIDKIEKELDASCFAFVFTVPIDVAIHNLGYDSTALEYLALNEMPFSDLWLYENLAAKSSVKQELKQAAKRLGKYLGSSVDYVNEYQEPEPLDANTVDLMKYIASKSDEWVGKDFPLEVASDVQTVTEVLAYVLGAEFVGIKDIERFEAKVYQAIKIVSNWSQERKMETYYCWKEVFTDDDGKPCLVTPHVDPTYYEHSFDYYFDSPEDAKKGLIIFSGEAEWVLCRETLEPIAPPMTEEEFDNLKAKHS